ncbi:MAG TPA: uroporphyrinogen decarboxylase family protein [Chloroflexota bacterium]
MNSRERILASINHTESDGVAVDLGATPSSGISAIAHDRLVRHLGLRDTRNLVYDVVQQLAQPSMELIDAFRIDALDVGRTFDTADNDWWHTVLSDGTEVEFPAWFTPVLQPDGSYLAFSGDTPLAKMAEGATFFDQTVWPYLDAYPANLGNISRDMAKVSWQAFAHSPWDHAGEVDFWAKLRENAIALRQSTGRALVIVCGCNLFEWGTFLRRLDNFLMDLVLCPDEVERLVDALTEIHLGTLAKVCAAVGDVVDIIRFGDDLGTDAGPFMAPSIYRRLFKPRHKLMCDYVKQHSQMHTFIHSCGSIYRLLPDLIDAGFEIINPVQITAADMEPAKLKSEFGKDVTFWGGGCDTRSVLNRGTPEEIKDHVRRNIESFAPGGGFVFNTVHNILPDVPPRNVVAMFEAVNEYR